MTTDLADEIPLTVCWRDLTSSEAAIEWEALAAWVEWLRHHYNLPLSEVPLCWYQHWPLVEELSALRTAWITAFIPVSRAAGAALDWHYSLELTRRRLTGWTENEAGGCNGGREHEPVDAATPVDPQRLGAAIEADLDARAI